MTTRIKTPTDREEWLALRKQGIGGSDMAAILGVSPWATPVDVWLDKTNQSQPIESNDAMWIGNELEDAVARRYADERGVGVVRHNFIEIDSDNHMIGNVDRLVLLSGEKVAAHMGEVRTTRGLEVKTSSMDEWEEVPAHYEAQVMSYMSLMPTIQSFDVAAMFYGLQKSFKVYNIARDETIIEAIRAVAKEFWERNVLTGTPPEPINENDCRTLWKRFNPGKKVVAPEHIAAFVWKIKEAKKQIKETEKKISDMTTEVMAAMEDGEILLDESGQKLCTWKNNKDGEKIDWQAVAEVAGATQDQIKEHTIVRVGARVFRT